MFLKAADKTIHLYGESSCKKGGTFLKVDPHLCLCGPLLGALVKHSLQRSCLVIPFSLSVLQKLFFIMKGYFLYHSNLIVF